MAEEPNDVDEAFDCSGNGSPCSERSTPPYLLWAKDLRYLLEDFEGYNLFLKFLSLSNTQNELQFWYACNGLKKLQRPQENERMANVAKSLCKDFIHHQGEKRLMCISTDARVEIQRRFNQQNFDENVFDEVQQEVYENLCVKHLEFVRSDIYVAHLQAADAVPDGAEAATYYDVVDESPNSSRSSTSGDTNQPSSSFLPTVQEVDDEVESALSDKTSLASMTLRQTAETLRQPEVARVAIGASANETSHIDCSNDLESASENASSTLCGGDGTSSAHRKQRVASSSKRVVGVQRSDESLVACGKGVANCLPNNSNQHNFVPAGGSDRKTDSKLTPTALMKSSKERMRSSIHMTQPGYPPNPYHTQRPYVPYLTTSAQDSELQSMSSDAATESSVSGANFRPTERHIMKYAKQNIESHDIVPRTQRGFDSQPHDMTNESFRVQVCKKLELWRKQNNMMEKLHVTLQTLADSDDPNSSKAALLKFSKFKEQAQPETEVVGSILDDHCTQIGWQDTPPTMRSPGIMGRRRSPGSKSPDRSHFNRMMTASYPVAFPSTSQPLTCYQESFGSTSSCRHQQQQQPTLDPSYNVHFTQSAYLPQQQLQQQQQFVPSPKHRGVGASYSASNTLHRHTRASAADCHSSVDMEKQRITNAPNRNKAHPSVFSDTSGISSCVSTDVSNDPRIFDHNPLSSGAKPKVKSAGTMPLGASPGMKMQKNSSSSSSSRAKSTVVNHDQTRSVKSKDSNKAKTTNQQQRPTASNVSLSDSQVQGGLSIGACKQTINVIYTLPNERTPFLTKFDKSTMTLKQFKSILTKCQSNYKYYFKTYSDEFSYECWQELLHDNDVVPFQAPNKILARIELSN